MKQILSLALLLAPAAALAHPGHGTDGPLHGFTEPEHALQSWAVAGAALLAAFLLRGTVRALSRR